MHASKTKAVQVLQNYFLQALPIVAILYNNQQHKLVIKRIDPKKPNSSENNVNIKSVCFSGRVV